MHWVNGCQQYQHTLLLLKSRKKTCHGSYYIDLARAKSEALDNIYSLLKQNIKSCNAKASKATRTVKKNNNNKRFNQQKSNFARAAHFFCTFLCRCLAQLQHVTRVIEEMSYVFLFTFFYHRRSFSPWWPLTFLIFLPPLQNVDVGLQQKMSPLFFSLSRSSSFYRWASLACCPTFSFSLSFSVSAIF